MKTIAILFCFIFCLQLHAQDPDIKRPPVLKSEGTVPENFTNSVEEIYENLILQSSIYRPRNERISELTFYQKSNFWIQDMLLSGDVLYGTHLNAYLNKVADKILENKPEIRKKLQFYIMQSPFLNAFSTDQGYIFVNLGLFSKVENEAQLAFILSHEIVHYLKKHNISGHLENYKIMNSTDKLSKEKVHDVLTKIHSYSQDLEYEADAEGISIFMQTDYAKEEAIAVFDELNDATIPSIKSSFDFSVFENNGYKINPVLFDAEKEMEETDEVTSKEAYSTHPAPIERQTKAKELLEANSSSKRKNLKFIVSEKDFNYAQRYANIHVPELLMLENRYVWSLYLVNDYIKKYPEYEDYFKLLRAKLNLRIYQLRTNLDFEIPDAAMELDHPIADLYKYCARENSLIFLWAAHTECKEVLKRHHDDEEVKHLSQFIYKNILDASIDYDLAIAKDLKELKESDLTPKLAKINHLSGTKRNNYLIFDPTVIIIDHRKDYEMDYLASEKAKNSLYNSLKEEGEKSSYDFNYITKPAVSTDRAIILNELKVVSTYIKEMLIGRDDYTVFPTNYFQIQNVLTKYKSDKIIWPLAINQLQNRTLTASNVILAAMFYPTLPIVLGVSFVPKKYLDYAFIEFDVEDHSYDVLTYNRKRLKLNNASSNSMSEELIEAIDEK